MITICAEHFECSSAVFSVVFSPATRPAFALDSLHFSTSITRLHILHSTLVLSEDFLRLHSGSTRDLTSMPSTPRYL